MLRLTIQVGSWPGLNLDSSTHFLQALGESILFSEPLSLNLSLGGC